MPNRRTLRLAKETLVELGARELHAVAGGAITRPDCTGGGVPTLQNCFSQWYQTCTCCTASNSCEV